MRELLNGIVDMHIHGTPSVANRLETWEYLAEMAQAGYRAIGLKDHFLPTTGIAHVFNEAPCNTGVEVVGSIVLNNAVGGLNISALESAYRMGARQVYFPTVSAKQHCDFLRTAGSFGGGGLKVKEMPISVIDDSGDLTMEAKRVVDFVQDHPDMVLCTGHIGQQEVDMVVDYAVKQQVPKVVICHPHYIVGASRYQVECWSKKGAYIDFTTASLSGIANNGKVPISVLEGYLSVVPQDKMVISSDFGQVYNGSPVEGMLRMVSTLVKDLMVSESQVEKMVKTTPAKLLCVED